MAYTSSEVKQRWNEQHYKNLAFSVPKDLGNAFAEECKKKCISFRSVIIDIITEYLEVGKDGQNQLADKKEV